MGVSLLAFFVLIEMPLGLHTVTIAHVAFNISFVTVVVRARLYSFDFTLEEAAMDLGANRWQTFFKVTLPLIAPGVVAGLLIALTLSLTISSSPFSPRASGSTTLPMQVYSMMRFGVTPKVNALSTLILAVVILIGVVGQFVVSRQEGKGSAGGSSKRLSSLSRPVPPGVREYLNTERGLDTMKGIDARVGRYAGVGGACGERGGAQHLQLGGLPG